MVVLSNLTFKCTLCSEEYEVNRKFVQPEGNSFYGILTYGEKKGLEKKICTMKIQLESHRGPICPKCAKGLLTEALRMTPLTDATKEKEVI